MPIAEMNNESLRPRVSTPKKIKMAVARTLTTPATTAVQRERRSREMAGRTVYATREKRVLGTGITNLMALLRIVRVRIQKFLLTDLKI